VLADNQALRAQVTALKAQVTNLKVEKNSVYEYWKTMMKEAKTLEEEKQQVEIAKEKVDVDLEELRTMYLQLLDEKKKLERRLDTYDIPDRRKLSHQIETLDHRFQIQQEENKTRQEMIAQLQKDAVSHMEERKLLIERINSMLLEQAQLEDQLGSAQKQLLRYEEFFYARCNAPAVIQQLCEHIERQERNLIVPFHHLQSLEAKRELLQCALATYQPQVLTHVILFLEATLSTKLLFQEMTVSCSRQTPLIQHYMAMLQERRDRLLLSKFVEYLHHSEVLNPLELAMIALKRSMKTTSYVERRKQLDIAFKLAKGDHFYQVQVYTLIEQAKKKQKYAEIDSKLTELDFEPIERSPSLSSVGSSSSTSSVHSNTSSVHSGSRRPTREEILSIPKTPPRPPPLYDPSDVGLPSDDDNVQHTSNKNTPTSSHTSFKNLTKGILNFSSASNKQKRSRRSKDDNQISKRRNSSTTHHRSRHTVSRYQSTGHHPHL